MALLIGANHIMRVAALKQVGWYQGHLTEDLATGKRFHAKRWQSVYVPLPLAVGEGPTTWAAYFTQQYRWASGCMHIFFSQSPWLNAKMRRAHGMYYFLLEQFYFSGLSMIVAAFLLLLYFGPAGRPPTWSCPARDLVLPAGGLAAARHLVAAAVQRAPGAGTRLPVGRRLVTIAAIPIYFLALVRRDPREEGHVQDHAQGRDQRRGARPAQRVQAAHGDRCAAVDRHGRRRLAWAYHLGLPGLGCRDIAAFLRVRSAPGVRG